MNKNTLFLVFLFLFTLVFGYAYCIKLSNTIRFSDEAEYLTIGYHLTKSQFFSLNGFTPTAWRPPVYPAFLASLMKLGFSLEMLRFANFALLGGIIALTYMILIKHSKQAAVIGLIGFVFYPFSFYLAGTFFPQTLGAFFLFLFFYLFNFTNRISAIFSGMSLGLAILTIPSFIIIPFSLVILPRFFNVQRIAITILCTFVVVSGWSARNYHTFDTFIPISTNAGVNLLKGNSPTTRYYSGSDVNISAYQPPKKLNEYELNDYYTMEALNLILENKKDYISLYFKKLAYFFYPYNSTSDRNYSQLVYKFIASVSYGVLLASICLRLFMITQIPFTKEEALVWTLYFSYALFLAIFFTRVRFRIPFDMLMIVSNAIFLSKLWVKREKLRSYMSTEN